MNKKLLTAALAICLTSIGNNLMAQTAGLKQSSTLTQATPTATTPTGVGSEEARLQELDPDAVARKYFNVETAPADFPVFDDQTMTRESYRTLLSAYAEAHPEILREKFRAQLSRQDK
jgi:hypothetical protein